MRPTVFVPFLCLMLACFGAQAQSRAPDFFAFVLFGEGSDGQPLPMVRSVAEGATACPVLRTSAGGGSTAMIPPPPPRGRSLRRRDGLRGPLSGRRGGQRLPG